MSSRGLAQALWLVGAAATGAAVVLGGCSSSAEVKFAGAEHPAVPEEQVEILGDQTPVGFEVTGVVTAVCEMMNGASGVFETTCSHDAMLALARQTAAAKGGHALVDMKCDKQLLERRTEQLDGGGVKTTTRERLTCQATVVRRGKGVPMPVAKASTSSSSAAKPAGRRVSVGDIELTVSFARGADFRELPARDLAAIGELDHAPQGYALLGKLTVVCADVCAPRHGRTALRMEAARLGASAIAGVHCEVAGADRWRCDAALIGDAFADASVADASAGDASTEM